MHIPYRCFTTYHDVSMQANHLEREGDTSSANNSSLDLGSIKKVGDSVGSLGKSTLLSSVLAFTEVVARLNSVARVSRVQRLLGRNEDVVLNEDLSALAGVDAVGDVLVVVVVEVAGTEAERGTAGVQVVQVVVGVGDSQVALVLGAVGVGVADEGGLPMVVEEGVGDGDVVGGVGNIEEAVVVVLVVVTVGREVEVVDPDVLGLNSLLARRSDIEC